MKLLDPKEIARETTYAPFGIGGGELLLIVIEGSSKTAFSVIVHLSGANLKFDNLFILRNDRGMNGLITVLLRHCNVILDAAVHRHKQRMNQAKDKIASCHVINNETERNKVINAINILVVFGKFFMERIDGFDAAVATIMNAFFFEEVFDGVLGIFELFVGEFKTILGEFLELFVTLWIKITEAGLLDLDANAPHLETVGKRCKDLKRFAGDFLLFIWRKGTKRA